MVNPGARMHRARMGRRLVQQPASCWPARRQQRLHVHVGLGLHAAMTVQHVASDSES